MTKFQVKLTTYDGDKAVDYAREHWSKVCQDGRVLTSTSGAVPRCGKEGFPEGTEFFHDAGWSQTYGGPSASDFIVIPAEGSDWQQNTETFDLEPQLKRFLQKYKGKTPPPIVVSEPNILRESLVKSIDKATIEQDSDTHPLYEMRLPLPEEDSNDWDLGHYLRHESLDDSPGSRKTSVRLLLNLREPEKIFTFEDPPFEVLPKAKLIVTYTYTKEGQRLSWGPIDDCAHFLSCCLHAGGLSVMPNDDTRADGGTPRACAYGQHGVRGLYKMFKWLAEEKHGKQVEFVADKKPWKEGTQTDEDAETEWKAFFEDNMNLGDLILYGWKNNQYAHSALYVGTMTTGLDPEEYPRIACHTYGRFPTDECSWDYARWNIGRHDPGRIYTLIHITSNTAT